MHWSCNNKNYTSNQKSSVHVFLFCLLTLLFSFPAFSYAQTLDVPTQGVPSVPFTIQWSGGRSYVYIEERVGSGSWAKIQQHNPSGSIQISRSAGTYSYRVNDCLVTATRYGASHDCSMYWPIIRTIVIASAPSAPASINVVANNTNNSFSISWPGVSGGITKYEVQHRIGSSAWPTTNIYSGLPTSYVLPNASIWELYEFRVRACININCSLWRTSSQKFIEPPKVFNLPQSSTTGNYSVSWSGAKGPYMVLQERAEVSSTWVDIGGGASGQVSRSRNSGTYHYRMRDCEVTGSQAGGYNLVNCRSWPEKSIVINIYVAPPATLVASPDFPSGITSLTWSASTAGGANKYEIEQQLNAGSWSNNIAYPISATTINRPAHSAAGTYKYRIRACREDGQCSPWKESSVVNYTIPAVPVLAGAVREGSTSGAYTISWNAVPNTRTYKVLQNGSNISNPTTNSISFSGATAKATGTYTYNVSACNALGCSIPSASKTIDVAIIGSPGSPTASGNLNTGVTTVSWGAASGSPTGYQVQQRLGSGEWSDAASVTGSVLTTALPAVTSPGSYSYQVRACKTVGQYTGCSAWVGSGQVSYAVPAVPVLSGAAREGSTSGAYTISWNAVPNTNTYKVLQNGSNISNPTTNSISFSGATAKATGTYTYNVSACNALGCSIPSASKTMDVAIVGSPGSPTASGNLSTGVTTVSWGAASGSPTGYQVQQRLGSGDWSDAASVTGSVLTAALPAVTSAGSYSYQVRACKTVGQYTGCSAWVSSGQVNYIMPSTPLLSSAIAPTSATGIFNISWGGVAGATTYKLTENGIVIQNTSATAISFSTSTKKTSGTYIYSVQACNSLGCSESSSSKTIDVAIISSPQNLAAEYDVSSGNVNLSWETPASGSPSYYSLERQLNGGNWSNPEDLGSSRFAVEAIALAADYVWRIRACKLVRQYLNCASATTSEAYFTPRSFNVSLSFAGQNEISIEWAGARERASIWESVDGGEWEFLTQRGTSGTYYVNRENGNYSYRIRDCHTISGVGGPETECTWWIEEKTITVNVPVASSSSSMGVSSSSAMSSSSEDSHFSETIDPINDPMSSENFYGALSGIHSVAPDSSFGYTLPIDVPPGVNGIQPAISLNYNSEAGNGLVGWGWTLSGMSSIARCGADLIRDGYVSGVGNDENYKYCIDGHRLVEISPGKYRTENERFTRIEKNNTHWIVTDAKGTQSTYGHKSEARQHAANFQDYIWHLDRIEDAYGNIIETYFDSNPSDGTHRPDRIEYAYIDQSAVHTINFLYESRDDVILRYMSGEKIVIDKRLSSIEVLSGGEVVRQYELNYQDYQSTYFEKLNDDPLKISRLSSVNSCVHDSSGESCLESVSFDWTEQNEQRYVYENMDNETISHIEQLSTSVPAEEKFQFYIDIDGDGKLEAYYAEDESQNFSRQVIQAPSGWVPENTFASKPTYQKADINGDGFDDVVKAWPLVEGVQVFLNHRDFTTGDRYIDQTPSVEYSRDSTGLYFTATRHQQNYIGFGQFGAITREVRIKQEFEYSIRFADVNGDGLLDMLKLPPTCVNPMVVCSWPIASDNVPRDISVALNTGNGFGAFGTWHNFSTWDTNQNFPYSSQFSYQFMDLNGNGLIDILAIAAFPSGPSSIYMGINNGLGAAGGSFNFISAGGTTGLIGDFNGDGYIDIANMPSKMTHEGAPLIEEKINVALGKGIGSRNNPAGGYTNSLVALQNEPFVKHCGNNREEGDVCRRTVVDFNGDGKDDLVEVGYRLCTSISCMATVENFEARVYLSAGSGENGGHSFSAPITYHTLDAGAVLPAKLLQFIDYNNDGLLEDDYRFKNNILQHRIETIVESSREVEIEYEALSSDRIYTSLPGFEHNADAASGDLGIVMQARLSPRRVGVKEIRYSNGVGGFNKQLYQYIGDKIHRSGYGSLGFSSIEKTELVAGESTGLKTITHYHQEANSQYNLAGRTKQQQVYTTDLDGDNLQLLSDTRFQWKVRIYGDDIDSDRSSPHYFAYVYQSSNQSWDLDGSEISDGLTRNFRDNSPNCSPLSDTPVLTANAGDSNDTEYHTDGVLLYSETATCDTSGSVASVQISATENLDISSNSSAWGLVGARKQFAWVGEEIANASPEAFDMRAEAYTYNAEGRLETKVIEPDLPDAMSIKRTTTYGYNSYGSVNSITESWENPANSGLAFTSRVTSIDEVYEADGLRRVTVTRPLELTETTEYHPIFGLPTSQIDANNLETITTYDGLGRPTLITYADATTTQIDYRKCNNCFTANSQAAVYTQSKTTGSSASRVYYDGFGRQVGSRTRGLDGTFVYTHQSWNARGTLASSVAPYYSGDEIKTTFNYYDALGRVEQVTHPDLSNDIFSYQGLTHSSTNRLNQTQTRRLNAAGWVMRSEDHLGTLVDFTYWSFGDLKTTLVNNNSDTLISVFYDNLGRKTQLVDPNTGTTNYTYNALDLLATQTDAEGQLTCFSYDALGRQTQRVDNASADCTGAATQGWTYDNKPNGKGLVGTLTGKNTDGSSYVEQYTYTPYSLPRKTTSTFDGTSYDVTQHYDGFNRPIGVTYPTGYVVENAYNNYGHIWQLLDDPGATPLWRADEADASGALKEFTFGNGTVTRQTFHPQTGRIETITASNGLITIQNHRYEFDSLGNLEQRQDLKNDVTQSFCYDGLNRITAARFDGCTNATPDYTYDSLGNIETKDGVEDTYVYGTTNTGTGSQLAGPHAVTQANGYTYHYDRNGNLTTATKAGASTKSAVYSAFNTPTSISQGSKWSTIVYGPHQGRIKHSDSNGRVTKYIGGLYEEITHNGVTQKIHYIGDQILFVQKEGSSPSESYQFLHRDHIGSLVAITGSAVTTHADVQYLSNGVWGERRFEQWNGPLDESFIPTGTARGFTDHEHLDSVGLIHMNGRVYDPVLGRFLSADPLIQAPHNTQSYNRYSYVFNNPLSFVDPSGYATEDIWVPGPSAAEREAAEQERRRQAMLDSYMQSLMEAASIDRMVDMYNNDKQREKLYLRLRHQSILGISTKGTVSQINRLSAQKTASFVAGAADGLVGGLSGGIKGALSELGGALLSKTNLLVTTLTLTGSSPQGIMLFRSASLAEVQDVMSCSCFRPGPNSYEGKLFALNIIDARTELAAFQLLDHKLGMKVDYGIIMTTVSRQYFSQLEVIPNVDSLTAPTVHVRLDQLSGFNAEANRHGIYWME